MFVVVLFFIFFCFVFVQCANLSLRSPGNCITGGGGPADVSLVDGRAAMLAPGAVSLVVVAGQAAVLALAAVSLVARQAAMAAPTAVSLLAERAAVVAPAGVSLVMVDGRAAAVAPVAFAGGGGRTSCYSSPVSLLVAGLAEVAKERAVWSSLLKLLSPQRGTRIRGRVNLAATSTALEDTSLKKRNQPGEFCLFRFCR